MNDQKVLPPAVFTGKQEYPSDVLTRIKDRIPNAVVVDGTEVARKIGNPRVLNVIFLGVLSKYLDIPAKTYEEALRESLKPKLVEINLKAFHEGRALAAV